MADPIVDKNFTALYGEGVSNYGICVRQAINGYGLLSYGMIWQGPEIWIKENVADGLTTTWTTSQSVITTTWTPATVFGYGNEFPEYP